MGVLCYSNKKGKINPINPKNQEGKNQNNNNDLKGDEDNKKEEKQEKNSNNSKDLARNENNKIEEEKKVNDINIEEEKERLVGLNKDIKERVNYCSEIELNLEKYKSEIKIDDDINNKEYMNY